jgi:hypothetical protein
VAKSGLPEKLHRRDLFRGGEFACFGAALLYTIFFGSF